MAMSRQKEPFTIALVGARRQVGRKFFFEARRIAAIIDQDPDELPQGSDPTAQLLKPCLQNRQQVISTE